MTPTAEDPDKPVPVYLTKKQWRIALLMLQRAPTPEGEFVKVSDIHEALEAIKEVLGEK